jgi:hypothetical protein
MAMGAMDAARDEFGLSIPEDLSVVGFDGVGPAAWPSYRVTTIQAAGPAHDRCGGHHAPGADRESPSFRPRVRSFTGLLIEGTVRAPGALMSSADPAPLVPWPAPPIESPLSCARPMNSCRI